MKKIVLISALLSISALSSAQGLLEALRYSRTNDFGTARYTAMGGSFGALGGESSALMNNPGGLGIYRNSEFTISTAFNNNSTESIFRSNVTDQNTLNFNIPNISFVRSYRGNADGWKNYSFSFAHNRTATFHAEELVQGTSFNGSSYLDPYVQILNNENVSVPEAEDVQGIYGFGPAQAFATFAIDIDTTTGEYRRWWDFPNLEDPSAINQERKREIRGRQTETYFAFGGNYQDRFYVGASLGISNLRYEEDLLFAESYSYSNEPTLGNDQIEYYDESSSLITLGTGFNFKIGGIVKLTDQFRLGLAYNSPTFYSMTDEFILDASAKFTTGEPLITEETAFLYDYQLRTPASYSLSAAYILGQQAVFNVDYEYVDYSNAEFDDVRGFEYSFNRENADIENLLTSTHNIRFGTEIRFDPFVARAGFRYESNPYAEGVFLNPDENRKTYSIGAGYRAANYNIDISYLNSQFQIVDPFYSGADAEAIVNNTTQLVTLTVGWKW